MTYEEALKIVLNKYDKVYSCTEFKSIFVFNIKSMKTFDSCVFVDKETKKLDVFNPLMFSLEDLKDGKEIKT